MLALSAGSSSLLIMGTVWMLGGALGQRWSNRARPDPAVRRALRQPQTQYRTRLFAIGIVFVILGLIVAAVE